MLARAVQLRDAKNAEDLNYFTGQWQDTIGPLWRIEFGASARIESAIKSGPEHSPTSRIRIATIDNQPAAAFETRMRRIAIELRWLLVEPRWQNQGIGTQLVRAVQREATDGHLGVMLEVLRCNRDAERLYRRLGFQSAGSIPHINWLRWRAPEHLDAVNLATPGATD